MHKFLQLRCSEFNSAPSGKVRLISSIQSELTFSTAPLAPLRGTESVLVVDDNADLRALFAGQMRSLGYRVTEAASGDDALALLEGGAGRFDFLLSDIMMPGKLNGVDLAKVARTRWPELRVLLISGHSGPAAVEEEARAFPLLHKPFRKMQLAQAVRLALASGMVAQADD